MMTTPLHMKGNAARMSSDYDASDWSEDFYPVVSLDHRNAGPVPIKHAQPATKPKRHELPTEDLRSHLKPLPKGYRLADDRYMTKYRKMNRTRSLKAAMEKREARQPIKIPVWQKGERRAVHAKLVAAAERRKGDSEALTIYGPYEILSACDTRTWEVELRAAVNWFVDTFGGPEHPEERRWREYREGWASLTDAHFGYDPDCGGDWTFEVPDREEMDPADFYRAREWNSPHLPPMVTSAMKASRSEAEATWERGGLEALANL